jgi:glycine dehydrogenase
MYAVYHGPDGMREIASHCHSLAAKTAEGLKAMGIEVGSDNYFDTICCIWSESTS